MKKTDKIIFMCEFVGYDFRQTEWEEFYMANFKDGIKVDFPEGNDDIIKTPLFTYGQCKMTKALRTIPDFDIGEVYIFWLRTPYTQSVVDGKDYIRFNFPKEIIFMTKNLVYEYDFKKKRYIRSVWKKDLNE